MSSPPPLLGAVLAGGESRRFGRDKTSEPLRGVTVTAHQLAGSILNIEGLINAVTDEQGRYRLVGLPKADGHNLSVYPPLDQPYFVTDFLEVPPGSGLEPITFAFSSAVAPAWMLMRPATWLIGLSSGSEPPVPVTVS